MVFNKEPCSVHANIQCYMQSFGFVALVLDCILNILTGKKYAGVA